MKNLSRSFSLSLVAAGLLASGAANAQSLAIINATLHTATEQGVLENASIVMDNGKIIEDCSKREFFETERSERTKQFLDKILHD